MTTAPRDTAPTDHPAVDITERAAMVTPMPTTERAAMLTVGEIAAELRILPITVRRLITAGQLRAHRIGRTYRVPTTALDEYLEATARDAARGGRGGPVIDLR